MSKKYEQLAASLETAEEIIEGIMEICMSDVWTADCQAVWEAPTKDNILDIATILKPGEYCWGEATLTIPQDGGTAYILS